MVLQASGQITASDIMAEWSYPASTQWKVSADGAGFINFAVSSIIKYSDFYNGSSSTGGVYVFQHNGGSASVSNTIRAASGGTVTASGDGVTLTSDDGTTTHDPVISSPTYGFSNVGQPLVSVVMNNNTSAGRPRFFRFESQATSGGRGPSIVRVRWDLPVSATSGVNYEFWSNKVNCGLEIAQRQEVVYKTTANMTRITAGTYENWAGYTDASRIYTTQVGSDHDGTWSYIAPTFERTDYFGDYSADNDEFPSIHVRSGGNTTGRWHTGIPGDQIIANGGQIRLEQIFISNGETSRAGLWQSGVQENALWSIGATTPYTNPNGIDYKLVSGPGDFTSTDWNGTIDPNGTIGTWDLYAPAGNVDRFEQWEVVEAGTY